MQERIDFKKNHSVTITDETVGAILLDINALQSDGTTVCAIADLNKISVELAVYRNGSKVPNYIFNDYLDNVLCSYSAGTTRYDIATTEQSTGYLMAIGFGGALKLKGNDYAVFKIHAQATAFTSLSTTYSDINFETIPATNNNPVLNVVEAVPYVSGEVAISKKLGSNITKIVLANDFTADYSASTKAKATNGITLNANGFSKEATENLLLVENLHYLQFNPDTSLKHLMLYNNAQKPLQKVHLTAKFDKAVDTDARILLVKKAIV